MARIAVNNSSLVVVGGRVILLLYPIGQAAAVRAALRDGSLAPMDSGLVFAAIAPHGDLAIPEAVGDEDARLAQATQRGMVELGRRFAEMAVDTVVIATPHNVHIEGRIAVGTAARMAGELADTPVPIALDCRVDRPLARALLGALTAADIPAVSFDPAGADAADTIIPMDWGTLIPLWFMGGRDANVAVVPIAPARDLDAQAHVRAGAAIAAAAGDSGKRVAFIASADHGHGHDAGGPYGYSATSLEYDRRVVEIVRAGDLAPLADFPRGFVKDALADSWWQMLMLHGAAPGWSAEVLSYEAPTYFGMMCAAFTPPERA
ncbi:MAG: extradiol ring-cleavage dioxygenase [Candidatus Dormibacteria bacterium]